MVCARPTANLGACRFTCSICAIILSQCTTKPFAPQTCHPRVAPTHVAPPLRVHNQTTTISLDSLHGNTTPQPRRKRTTAFADEQSLLTSPLRLARCICLANALAIASVALPPLAALRRTKHDLGTLRTIDARQPEDVPTTAGEDALQTHCWLVGFSTQPRCGHD